MRQKGVQVISFETRNPRTGEVLKTYPVLEEAEVRDKIRQARDVLPGWKASSLAVRQKILKYVVRHLQQQLEPLAESIALESGKSFQEAIQDDLLCAIGVLDYTANLGPKILRERMLPLEKGAWMGHLHWERRVPKGVVGVISPWNYPFAIPTSGVCAALMGGNTVVLKPSELTTGVGELVVSAFQAALQAHGFPREVVQLVTGDGRTGAALVNGEIDYAIFTGSAATGCKVRDAMQARGKSVSLELGGSDPMIVLPGADVDAVTTYALWGRFGNSGQACAAVKRLLVPETEYEAIVSCLRDKIAAMRKTGHCVNPVISQAQRDCLANQVRDALDRGAVAVTGGELPEGEGYFYPWTLLTQVPPEARVLNEEVFGPVLPVLPYQGVEQAIQLANQIPYGLGASVFGPPQEAAEVAKRLEAGMVVVNDVPTIGYALPALPWQGWKQSGPGVSHGPQGLLETTQLQVLTRNYLYHLPLFRKQPWHFETTPDVGFAKALVRFFGEESWVKKLHPAFLGALLKHRSSRKL